MGEILANLENLALEDDEALYCTPPVHDGEISDQDSDISDIEEGNLNHLGRGLLQAEAHVGTKTKNNSDHKIKFLDDELIESCKSVSYKWSKEGKGMKSGTTAFTAKPPSTKSTAAKTPLEFFQLFFDDSLIDKILEETNHYSKQKNADINVSKQELMVFLGSLILLGYMPVPNKRLYWDRDDDVPKY